MDYLVIFGASLLTAVIVIPIAIKLSHRLGIVARPGGRRKHAGIVPKLGGVPLIFALMVAWSVIFFQFSPLRSEQKLLTGIILGSIIMVIGGLIDDKFDLPPRAQTIIHLIGALVAIRFDVFIEVFTSPATLLPFWQIVPMRWLVSIQGTQVWMIRPLAIIFTLFWVVGMINAVNWLDGLDGLAAGVGAIAALVFAWHSYTWQNFTIAAFPLALAGALLGFLFFNFAPARIYLGSAGAYLLGYQLATLSIVSPAKVMTALLVLALPILDVAWRIIDRVRQGRNPFEGDRGHLHFILVDKGLPVQQIVLGYYVITIIFGVVVLWLPSPGLKIVTMIGLTLAIIFFLIVLSRRETEKTAVE